MPLVSNIDDKVTDKRDLSFRPWHQTHHTLLTYMTCWEPGTQPVQEQVISEQMSLTMRFLSKVPSFVEELMSIN